MKKLIVSLLLACMLFAGCKPNPVPESPSSALSSAPPSSQPAPSSEPESLPESEPEPSSEPESEPEQPANAEPLVVEGVDLSDLDQYENEKKGWGQGYEVDELNRPTSCNLYQEKYGEYGALFIKEADEKKMYLTFDEGYENGYTEKILDTLKEKECPAVFFVTLSYVKANPGLIRRMIDEGHVVGNHSNHHKSMPTLSAEEAVTEITDLHNYMLEEYQYTMTLFRPPMGEWSTRTAVIAKRLGYQTVLWSFAYKDYDVDAQMGVEKAFPRVTGAAHPGAVYLLHAVSKDNTEMLGDVIDNLREQGYSLEKLA